MYPQEYRYTREHEWIKLDGERATVGITHYAQEQLGDIVFVELPKPGAHFETTEALGTVESVKAVSELYCPVAGTVEEVNSRLNDNPALLNQEPHGSAWLIKIKIDTAAELDSLLTAEQYEAFIRAEPAERGEP
ncbi:MAG: glycine cleavage system protein GcvH [Terriglobia bacterium]